MFLRKTQKFFIKINSKTLRGSWVCHIYKTMIETLIMIEIVIFVIIALNQ